MILKSHSCSTVTDEDCVKYFEEFQSYKQLEVGKKIYARKNVFISDLVKNYKSSYSYSMISYFLF